MTQVCLNMTNAVFLYTDLEISTYLSVCKLYLWTEILMEFLILGGWKMTFWTACLFSPYW